MQQISLPPDSLARLYFFWDVDRFLEKYGPGYLLDLIKSTGGAHPKHRKWRWCRKALMSSAQALAHCTGRHWHTGTSGKGRW